MRKEDLDDDKLMRKKDLDDDEKDLCWNTELSPLPQYSGWLCLTSELRSPFGPSGRLASRRPSARLEPSLKKLVD
jgi:hypothetical protein